MTMDIQKKKIEKKKSQNWSLQQKKEGMFPSNKKTNSSTILPILLEPRKEGWYCSNVLVGNPRLVN